MKNVLEKFGRLNVHLFSMTFGRCALKLGSCRCAGCGRYDRSAALRADCAAERRTEYSSRPSPCVAESHPRSAPSSGSRRAGVSRPNVEIFINISS